MRIPSQTKITIVQKTAFEGVNLKKYFIQEWWFISWAQRFSSMDFIEKNSRAQQLSTCVVRFCFAWDCFWSTQKLVSILLFCFDCSLFTSATESHKMRFICFVCLFVCLPFPHFWYRQIIQCKLFYKTLHWITLWKTFFDIFKTFTCPDDDVWNWSNFVGLTK